ncbi:hypothetical protein HKK52_00070 [Pseudomonas sp. ADAK2]|uniref:hypothetical protein n=1 Tax=unclassified Pseudomonas TaxID=196821 RepID=UPI001462B98B|nr:MULTISPECIES: hypothetical protein [unclassified Pseudomonas]QJI39400.1 hypothetical protein HKK53_00070 [Pseudomonas sp. ADAK7]QJI45706.1 hypothetical protein HKK52_00070 [Pseudomonas sp. ADAK2]
MSIIAIVLDEKVAPPQALLKFHKALGLSLQSVRDSWIHGHPVVELEIFEGDYQQKSKDIRLVLKIIDEENLGARFYEIPFGEKYAGNQNLKMWEIDASIVINILDAADKEVERQMDN